MPRRNEPIDVFKHIDMSAGDNECWTWKLTLDKGRPYFTANGQKRLAYRWVYELITGDTLETDDMICHQCDNPQCCNPKHLLKGDHDRNTQDMVERDRHGIPHHAVRGIRALLAEGNLTHREIAERYGVKRETVTSIKNGHRRSGVK